MIVKDIEMSFPVKMSNEGRCFTWNDKKKCISTVKFIGNNTYWTAYYIDSSSKGNGKTIQYNIHFL